MTAAFTAFAYSSDDRSDPGLKLCLSLPAPLPATWIFPPGADQAGMNGHLISSTPVKAVSQDLDFGRGAVAALSDAINNPPRYGKHERLQPIWLSIDHANLVLHGLTRDIDGIAASVEWLVAARRSLLQAQLPQRAAPAPRYLSFQQRPHWRLIPRNDSYLRQIPHTREGYDHQAHEIVVSENYGLPFLRLRHTWKTMERRNERDIEVQHSENLCEFATTFPFREVTINWGLFSGQVYQLESAAFNKAYKVRSSSHRFVSDIFHPQLMEYMLHHPMPAFKVHLSGRIEVRGFEDWKPGEIDQASQALTAFFRSVRPFVWAELGATPTPQIGPPRA